MVVGKKEVVMLKPAKILVPTDFSEYSDKALRQGLDIAKQYNATVYLYHVIEDPHQTIVDYSLPEAEITALERDEMEVAKKMMQKQLEKFPQAQEVSVNLEVGEGHPSEEILRAVKKLGVDLIVIASLGRTGLAKYFIGGIARNVLKAAEVPVLLTK